MTIVNIGSNVKIDNNRQGKPQNVAEFLEDMRVGLRLVQHLGGGGRFTKGKPHKKTGLTQYICSQGEGGYIYT